MGTLFPTAPVRGEFQAIARVKSQPCSVSLPSLAKTGIRYECRQWIDTTATLPQWSGLLDFQFQQISKTEWQTLRQIYGNWHNADLLPTYQPQHRYSLLDFLPPLIQALDRHRLISQQHLTSPGFTDPSKVAPNLTALRSNSMDALITANCWGTTYEILRLAHQLMLQPPVLFATADRPMRAVLNQNSHPVIDPVKPGDILLISHQHGDRTYLDHTAIAVDESVFFEKAGSGDNVPYRLVDLATLQQIWRSDVFDYEYRRPHAQASFPHPRSIFSLQHTAIANQQFNIVGAWAHNLIAIPAPDSPTTWIWIQQLPTLKLRNHRYSLASSLYQR